MNVTLVTLPLIRNKEKLKKSYLTENILLKFIFCSSSALICRSQLERKPIVCSKCQCTTNKPGFPPHLEFPTQNQHTNKFTQNWTKQKENITKYYRNTKKYITLGISNPKILTNTLKIPITNKIPTNIQISAHQQQTWCPNSFRISNSLPKC